MPSVHPCPRGLLSLCAGCDWAIVLGEFEPVSHHSFIFKPPPPEPGPAVVHTIPPEHEPGPSLLQAPLGPVFSFTSR